MKAIEAAYPSRCEVCDQQIYEGDLIVRLDDEPDGAWVHEECDEQ